MEQTKLVEKVQSKIDDLEVDLVLQKELVTVLESLQVSGAQAAEVAQRIAAARSQLTLSELLLAGLKAKYEASEEKAEK